jgi:ketosteroid isomerase-like protein
MSQENVEIVKAALDAANRDDWDALFQDMTPDFELDMSRAIGPLFTPACARPRAGAQSESRELSTRTSAA